MHHSGRGVQDRLRDRRTREAARGQGGDSGGGRVGLIPVPFSAGVADSLLGKVVEVVVVAVVLVLEAVGGQRGVRKARRGGGSGRRPSYYPRRCRCRRRLCRGRLAAPAAGGRRGGRPVQLLELLEQVLAELHVVGHAVDGHVVHMGDGLEGGLHAGSVAGEVHEAVAALLARALREGNEEQGK